MTMTLTQLLELANTVRGQTSATPEAMALARGLLSMLSKLPPADLVSVAEGGWVTQAARGCVSPKLARACARSLLEAADDADRQARDLKATKRGVGGS